MTSAHNPTMTGDFMTPAEVQAALGISRRTLWRYRAKGDIKPAHFTPTGHARFARVDVNRLLKERAA